MHYTTLKVKGLVKLSTIAVATTCTMFSYASPINGFDESNLPTKYIVKFKEQAASPSALSNNTLFEPRITKEAVLDQLKAQKVEKLGRSDIYSVEIEESKLGELRDRSDVEYVEVDPPRYLLSETVPWGYEAVNAQLLDDSNAGNRTVCIIDSGYDLAHGDLNGNSVSGTNDSGTGSWSVPGNNNAHGTHVAGTIAAITNTEGVKGIMPNQNVNLHIVKVFNEQGWGYSSSLVRAIQTCADNGADVVNMSLGGSQSSVTERNALQNIYNQGVLLIAAAGNDGNTAHSYPASYGSVMSVAAVDNNNDHAAFSQATNQVDIAAPGVAVLSTVTLGEGKLSDIVLNGDSQFSRGVVPHNRLVQNGDRYAPDPVAGSITAELASCDVTGNSFNCGDMTGKICLVERIGNQSSGNYPEIDAVQACYEAGASATIVYSNNELPGLQNPFLVDQNNTARMVSVTVDRTFGQELLGYVGQNITVSTTENEDYEYYNGTSMATPHVTGVAGLVWSFHPTCTAAQVRNALTKSATDIDVVGRDNRTGFGLINAEAAKQYLDAGCDGPEGSDGADTATYTNSNAVPIPDNNPTGAVSSLDVDRSGDAGSVVIELNISHTYIGDLRVTLTSPNGRQVVLHNNEGGSADDIITSFQANFSGVESQGTWQLRVVDSASRDVGTINSWTLTFQ
ncbi:S8 family serine peptidase [Vibrio sp. D420a]|uniref:S8 family serine peptidase n=1 Tax=Vibrio sp. D420a TaxID=2836895 RepID=UPI0025526F58|nr:S8 family serine peptidase [Vibrio sp. D420a]MDK9764696.1 S8 family serine peptidase [Vibrio sp. D420a]